MKLRGITFEKSEVDTFWDKYIKKSVVVLPIHAEKWYMIKKDNNWDGLLKKVDVFVADGIGLIRGYKFLTGKKPIKISGADLVDSLIEKYPRTPTYIWGTTKENIQKAAKEYKKRGMNIVSFHNGFTGEDEDIIADIKKNNAKVCFVGNSAKRAAELAVKIHEELKITTMTAGGLFDVASGEFKRAPMFFQKVGLEWFWRMIVDLKRFKRLPTLFGFVWYVLLEKFQNILKGKNENKL